jgi:hypothetical protein
MGILENSGEVIVVNIAAESGRVNHHGGGAEYE